MVEMKEKKIIKRIINEDQVRPYKSPGQRKQLKILFGVIILIIILGVTAYFLIIPKDDTYLLKDYETAVVIMGDLVQTVQASGTVAIPTQMNVINQAEAYVRKLYVKEGDVVKKGQLLAQLESSGLEEELEDLQISLDDAKNSYKKAETQHDFAIKKIERNLQSLETEILEAEEEVAKLEELVKINASRQSELDTAKKSRDSLNTDQEDLKASLDEEKQLYTLDVSLRQSNIKQLEIKKERIVNEIDSLAVKSPMNGDILEYESSLAVPGSLINANTNLFTITDPSSAIVELEVLEDYAGLLSIGQELTLTISGLNIPSRIISIGKIAQMTSDGLGATIMVKAEPYTEENESLLLGATAIGTLIIGSKSNTLLLPRGPYLTTGSQKYLYRVQNNKASRINVTFGTIQGNDVEVLAGVEEGDLIIISGYQNFIEYKEITVASQ